MTDEAGTLGIVGAGRFGTALGHVAASNGRDVLLYSRSREVSDSINEEHCNPRMADVALSESLSATHSVKELAERCRLIIVAVPSTEVVARLRSLGGVLTGGHFLVHAIGGLVVGARPVSEVIPEETRVIRSGVLAGPAFSTELLAGDFSSMVAASPFKEVTNALQDALTVPSVLQIYPSSDLAGVELASALASAYSVALGMADGLGMGSVAKAVLITRAVAESAALGGVYTAENSTFSGLAGLGNILVRSMVSRTEYSRDFQAGRMLVSAKSDALSEGVRTAPMLSFVASANHIAMPLLQATADVATGKQGAADALSEVARTTAAF